MKVSMSEEFSDGYGTWIEDYFVGRCENCGNRLYSIDGSLVTVTGRSVCILPWQSGNPHVLRNW